MPKNFTTEDFIKKAKEVHGNRYDYSKVEYIDSKSKICIICPEHGEFWQIPHSHLQGCGCSKCGQVNRMEKITSINQEKYNTSTFIEKAKETHGDKYDYSKVEYVDSFTKVCIVCPEHGEFWQAPYMHIMRSGCPKCAKNHSITQEEFIQKARNVHGDKYDYSKVHYTRSHDKITIICPEHGEFEQVAREHLKYGCLKCSQQLLGNRCRKDTEYFIKKAKGIYGDKYDYSKVEYKSCETPVCIICPEHGEFWQTPHMFLAGHGCVKCANENNIHEQRCFDEISSFFKGEKVIGQKKFPWLKYKRKLSLDIFIEKYNIAIECQGPQHFIPVGKFGGELSFGEYLKRDLEKIRLCKENGITLLHYAYDKKYVPSDFQYYEVIFSIDDLKSKIEKHINDTKRVL